jgi:hypothetical protein
MSKNDAISDDDSAASCVEERIRQINAFADRQSLWRTMDHVGTIETGFEFPADRLQYLREYFGHSRILIGRHRARPLVWIES